MYIDELRDYCLSLDYVTEGTPFGPENLVFYIGNKMFCLIDIENFKQINVKCDPDNAVELRATYEGVIPGYHMNKKHWNSLLIDSDISDELIKLWVKDSYNLVYNGLPKKVKEAINLSLE